MEKGKLCQDVEEEGGREIMFNIFSGIHIVTGAGGGGGGRWGRLTLTQISSVSLDVECVFKERID